MIVTGSISKVRKIIKKVKRQGKTIGFIPTMGALHLGHLSLVRQAKKESDFVVVSIFVNPVQFGPKEDFKRYPKNLLKDKRLLKKENVDLVFCPKVSAMYALNHSTYVEETYLSKVLCGKFRPGHFKGVCTVVTKLFNIVAADTAYFGQKDYQQAIILKRLTQDLNFLLKIKVLPIIREKDGLAMSSRNAYLSDSQRQTAVSLYDSLMLAKALIGGGERKSKIVLDKMRSFIYSKKITKIEYIKIVDALNLRNAADIQGMKILIALAVYAGKTRLIDNIILTVNKKGEDQ